MIIKVGEIGFAAYCFYKKLRLIRYESSTGKFEFETGDLSKNDLKIEFLNSGYDEYHSCIKRVLGFKKDRDTEN